MCFVFLREFVLPLSSSEESSYVRIPLFQDITFISANVRGVSIFFLLLEAGFGQSAPNPRATVSCSFKTRLTMNFSQKRCLRLLRRSSLVTSEQYSLTRRLRRKRKKKKTANQQSSTNASLLPAASYLESSFYVIISGPIGSTRITWSAVFSSAWVI